MKRNNATFIKALLFGAAVLAAFTLYSNYGVPEIKSDAPVQAPPADPSAMTADELAALGEALYNGKGACALCHEGAGARAPRLDTAAIVAEKRIVEPGYKGAARTGIEYLRESLYQPSAHVVEGFGAVVDGKTVSPMPDVRSAAIGLTEAEASAVIAYLQKRSGLPVTVKAGADNVAGAESVAK